MCGVIDGGDIARTCNVQSITTAWLSHTWLNTLLPCPTPVAVRVCCCRRVSSALLHIVFSRCDVFSVPGKLPDLALQPALSSPKGIYVHGGMFVAHHIFCVRYGAVQYTPRSLSVFLFCACAIPAMKLNMESTPERKTCCCVQSPSRTRPLPCRSTEKS